MENKKFILTIIVCLLFGYVLGIFFPLGISEEFKHPFNLSILKDEGIQGKARVEIILEMDNGRPLDNVEVDLAEEPGVPPIGGTALSDENGMAVFNVKPGSYYIFFNDNNFPKNVAVPEIQRIEAKEDEISQKTIILNIR